MEGVVSNVDFDGKIPSNSFSPSGYPNAVILHSAFLASQR